jgi:hypothetical protein
MWIYFELGAQATSGSENSPSQRSFRVALPTPWMPALMFIKLNIVHEGPTKKLTNLANTQGMRASGRQEAQWNMGRLHGQTQVIKS